MLSLNGKTLALVKDGPLWFCDLRSATRAKETAQQKAVRWAWIATVGRLLLLAAGIRSTVLSRGVPLNALLERYFEFQRTVHFGSSVSPASAILLLGAAMMCWPLWHLRRLRLNSLFRVESPFAPRPEITVQAFARLKAIDDDMVETVTHPCGTAFRRPLALAIAAAFVVFLYQISYRFIPSVEGPRVQHRRGGQRS